MEFNLCTFLSFVSVFIAFYLINLAIIISYAYDEPHFKAYFFTVLEFYIWTWLATISTVCANLSTIFFNECFKSFIISIYSSFIVPIISLDEYIVYVSTNNNPVPVSTTV